MDLDKIKEKVRGNQYVYTDHADTERRIESLTFAQIETAILNAEVLESYSDTGRGESCLIVGFADETPIHVVRGWRGESVAIITVYVPQAPHFWIRGREETDEQNKMQHLRR